MRLSRDDRGRRSETLRHGHIVGGLPTAMVMEGSGDEELRRHEVRAAQPRLQPLAGAKSLDFHVRCAAPTWVEILLQAQRIIQNTICLLPGIASTS